MYGAFYYGQPFYGQAPGDIIVAPEEELDFAVARSESTVRRRSGTGIITVHVSTGSTKTVKLGGD
jgi:hypothetical protein